MHLSFEKIRIKRFGLFQSEATLSFNSAGPGLYFLKGYNAINPLLGPNATGKSTVLKALRWCLEGKTAEGLRNPDIVPWTGKGTTEVELTIKVDNKTHTIMRTVNPNKLTIDDKEAGQDYVQRLIQIPFDLFPFTIVMGQEQELFFDKTAGEKLALFNKALNLEKWDERSKHAAALSLALEKEIETATIELAAETRAQSNIAADIEALKQKSEQFEAEREMRLAAIEKEKTALLGDIKAAQKIYDTADLAFDSAETELKAIEKSLTPLLKKEWQYNKDIDDLENQKAILTKEQNEHTAIYAELKVNKHCPTCNQPLVSKQLQKELEHNLQAKLKSVADRITEIEKSLAHCVAEFAKVSLAANKQGEAKETFLKKSEVAKETLHNTASKLATFKASLKVQEASLAKEMDFGNPYVAQLREQKKRLNNAVSRISNLQNSITSKTQYLTRTQYWIKGFKDIKLQTIEDVLQELEIVTNAMLDELGLVGWQILYDIERETKQGTIARGLNITVLSPHNKQAVKWEAWSGGIKQRLRIVGTSALSSVLLNHVGATVNLECYDEPTRSLSKEGVQALIETLAERAKTTNKCIWLVDHHAVEQSSFAEVVVARREKQGSYLEIV